MSNQLSITHLVSGGLITNYFCSSACRHCLYRSSSEWKKDFISIETAQENFKTIRGLGCTSVHIGGGEPLLRPDSVVSVLDVANEMGVRVAYIETNSSWFKDHEQACDVLGKLVEKGLGTLFVSISPFHNEHIPFYKVKGVIEACRKIGLSIFPWVTEFVSDIETFDDKRTHSIKEYQDCFGSDYCESILRRYWISPGGRALETFKEYSSGKTIQEHIDESGGGCAELAEVGHFHLDLYGNYIPGLCAGLSIKREDLGKPLDHDEYPIISRVFAEGMGGLVSYAAREYGFKATGHTYASKCELCYEIRRYLVVEKGVVSKELQPQGHYLNN